MRAISSAGSRSPGKRCGPSLMPSLGPLRPAGNAGQAAQRRQDKTRPAPREREGTSRRHTAERTKFEKRGSCHSRCNKKANKNKAPAESRRDQRSNKHQRGLKKVANRPANPPQQGGEREKPQTARDERRDGEAYQV